jgi:hypothetical protein
MLKFVVPILNPLILFVTWWLFFYSQQGVIWIVAIALLAILISGRILAGNRFGQYKLLWINLITVYVSQFLFLLLATSDNVRYGLSFLLVIIWAVIWWLLKNYFQNIKEVSQLDYLSFNRFFYYLGFWFLITSLYALIIFLNLSPWIAIGLAVVISWFWIRDIIRIVAMSSQVYTWFIMLVLVQILAMLYLLPISFYVTGTIATLWLFFIIDSAVSEHKYFKRYLALFLLSIIILIFTAII